MTSVPLLLLLGASTISLVSSQGEFRYMPMSSPAFGPSFNGGPGPRMMGIPQSGSMSSSIQQSPSGFMSPARNSPSSFGTMRSTGTLFADSVPRVASIPSNSRSGPTTSELFSLGVTEDGQEGYYGPNGGQDGFPYLGGAGQDDQYNDGGVRAGVANGYGAGSYRAFLEKQRLGVNDPFPHSVGPSYEEIWSRYQRSLPGRSRSTSRNSLSRLSSSSTGLGSSSRIGQSRMPMPSGNPVYMVQRPPMMAPPLRFGPPMMGFF